MTTSGVARKVFVHSAKHLITCNLIWRNVAQSLECTAHIYISMNRDEWGTDEWIETSEKM